MRDSFQLAIKNIAEFGDTDVFPFPIENRIFEDCADLILTQLEAIHASFDDYFNQHAPVNHSALAPVGYTGFRWATQIDPLWNAYFLALVVKLGPAIEAARLRTKQLLVQENCIQEHQVFPWVVAIRVKPHEFRCFTT